MEIDLREIKQQLEHFKTVKSTSMKVKTFYKFNAEFCTSV